MARSRTGDRRHERGRLWPFGPAAAVAGTITLLVVLIAAFAALKSASDWPADQLDQWVLLALFGLALLPVLLAVLDRMSLSGGSLEVRGIKVAFAAVAQEQTTVVVPRNMGVPAGLAIGDSGGGAVLEGLKRFSKHDVVVIDLEDGTAWWETRLAVVCAGATRLGRPRAVVFLATQGGVERRFQGWAAPKELLATLRLRDPHLRRALDDAEVLTHRWRLAFLPPSPDLPAQMAKPSLPAAFSDPAFTQLQWMVFNDGERNEYASEQILMHELSALESPEPRGITIVRLQDLFGAILHTESIDEQDPADRWLAVSLSQESDYLAVTRAGVYLGVLSHRALVNHVLTALAEQHDGPSKAPPGSDAIATRT